MTVTGKVKSTTNQLTERLKLLYSMFRGTLGYPAKPIITKPPPVADSEWFIMGDFNSDGLADRFYYKRKQEKGSIPKVYIAFSKGNSQDSIHNVTLPYLKEVSTGEEDHYLYIPTDINGDGVTDIIECADEKFHIFIFDKYTKQFNLYKSIKPGQDKRHTVLSANVQTKNGYSTEFVSIDGEKLIKYSFQRNDSEECLLTGVVNSFGWWKRMNMPDERKREKRRNIQLLHLGSLPLYIRLRETTFDSRFGNLRGRKTSRRTTLLLRRGHTTSHGNGVLWIHTNPHRRFQRQGKSM